MNIIAGNTVCLVVEYRDGGGNLVDPPDPSFDILDPAGVVVASGFVPTQLDTGRYRGCWLIPATSEPGDWVMRFTGTIDGSPMFTDCPFTVTAIEPSPGPCQSWPVDMDCCKGLPEDLDPALMESMTTMATRLLWAASGRRYGPCPVTIRPCLRRCLGSELPTPYKGSDGAWRNFSACGCPDACSCVDLCEVILPGPVAGIQEVRVDGEIVDPSHYRLDRVDGGWRLVSLAGCWPSCQDLLAACDEPGAFCVTYLQGLPLDDAAIAAHSQLVCELVKGCLPDCDCALPPNVVRQTRAGVVLEYGSDGDWMRTLPLVDAWLASVNPNKLQSASQVWSPDVPQVRTHG